MGRYTIDNKQNHPSLNQHNPKIIQSDVSMGEEGDAMPDRNPQ